MLVVAVLLVAVWMAGQSAAVVPCCYPDRYTGEVWLTIRKLTENSNTSTSQNRALGSNGDDTAVFTVDFTNQQVLIYDNRSSFDGRQRSQWMYYGDFSANHTLYVFNVETSSSCLKIPTSIHLGDKCVPATANLLRTMTYGLSPDVVYSNEYSLKVRRVYVPPTEQQLDYSRTLVLTNDMCLPTYDQSQGKIGANTFAQHAIFFNTKSGTGNSTDLFQQFNALCKDKIADNASADLRTELLDYFYDFTRAVLPGVFPTTCCRPDQWQASINEVYTSSKDDGSNQSSDVKNIPTISFDYVAQKMSAVKYMYNATGFMTDNFKLVAYFLPGVVYVMPAVDTMTERPCEAYKIPDNRVLTGQCLSLDAKFVAKLTMGTMQVNVWETQLQTSSYTQSSQHVVSVEGCTKISETFSGTYTGGVFSGRLMISNVKAVVDPDVFVVPAECTGVVPQDMTDEVTYRLNVLEYGYYF